MNSIYLYFLEKNEQKNVEQNTISEFENYSVKSHKKREEEIWSYC